MTTAIVTGSNGFLGRYLARQLSADGWRVIGLDRSAPPANAPTGCARTLVMQLPSRDFDAAVLSIRPAIVVHASGPSSVPASLADPAGDFANSVPVLLNVLESVRRHAPACRIVFLSSAAVYGNPAGLPVDEAAVTAPISPYGHHKLMCESLLKEFYAVYALQSCAVRIFSAYGQGLRRQVLWDICWQALTQPVVKLMGTGAESRDFVHAEDIAQGIMAVIARGNFDARDYNLATGVETRIDALAQLLIGALGKHIAVEFTGAVRPGDPTRWRANIDRLGALGYVPKMTIQEGAAAYAQWAVSHAG
jgi:UDP-glucose 4-epimerase